MPLYLARLAEPPGHAYVPLAGTLDLVAMAFRGCAADAGILPYFAPAPLGLRDIWGNNGGFSSLDPK